jgi:hypothetical protein
MGNAYGLRKAHPNVAKARRDDGAPKMSGYLRTYAKEHSWLRVIREVVAIIEPA